MDYLKVNVKHIPTSEHSYRTEYPENLILNKLIKGSLFYNLKCTEMYCYYDDKIEENENISVIDKNEYDNKKSYYNEERAKKVKKEAKDQKEEELTLSQKIKKNEDIIDNLIIDVLMGGN